METDADGFLSTSLQGFRHRLIDAGMEELFQARSCRIPLPYLKIIV
jgi:hypothetical protein